MLSALDKQNLQSFKFNMDIAEKIGEICSPLFNNFKINTFSYVKLFKNGTMLRTSTEKNWTQTYFMNQYYNDLSAYNFDNIPENSASVKIITNKPEGEIYSAVYEHNIWNIFRLYQRIPEGAQVWTFATDRDNPQIVDFYFNHRDILQNFMDYFKERAESILIPHPDILITTELKLTNQKSDENAKIKKFLDEIGKTNKSLDFSLSSREKECIQYLIMGKSAKEIARCLHISYRTVEFHINKIRQKTGCKRLGSLLNFVFERGLLQQL